MRESTRISRMTAEEAAAAAERARREPTMENIRVYLLRGVWRRIVTDSFIPNRMKMKTFRSIVDNVQMTIEHG